MDQHAFRQMLSSTAAAGSASSSSAGRPADASRRHFGKQQKRSGGVTTRPAAAATEKEKPLLPRHFGHRAGGKRTADADEADDSTAADSIYVDRAEARRRGKEDANEFAEVERLRADFERRLASTSDPTERQQLHEQMAFLGGDAKHSILVRGLDFALLEQQRAKLADEEAGSGKEDDLETAYARVEAAPKRSERPIERVSSAAGPSSLASAKFKPIAKGAGFKPIGGVEEAPEYIWRNGKRMRKKRKQQPDEATKERGGSPAVEVEPMTKSKTSASVSAKASTAKEKHPATTKHGKVPAHPIGEHDKPVQPRHQTAAGEGEEAASDVMQSGQPMEAKEATMSPSAPSVADRKDDDDDEKSSDEDIFAGAGRWDGLADEDSDSDDDKAEAKESTIAAPLPANGKKDWFSTSAPKSDADGEQKETLPAGLDAILSRAKEAQAGSLDVGATPEEGEVLKGDEAEKTPATMRLTGLSDSILDAEDVRYLLDRETNRKAKRAELGDDKQRKRKRKKKGVAGDDSE